ncbi:MAG: heavy-metal-associated domain-containing protein, partial [Limisphaerales bacterium]
MSDDQSWTASLKVEGMRCQHCVGQVREVLNQYVGVLSVEVDLSAANVLVQCKPEVSVKDLCQA